MFILARRFGAWDGIGLGYHINRQMGADCPPVAFWVWGKGTGIGWGRGLWFGSADLPRANLGVLFLCFFSTAFLCVYVLGDEEEHRGKTIPEHGRFRFSVCAWFEGIVGGGDFGIDLRGFLRRGELNRRVLERWVVFVQWRVNGIRRKDNQELSVATRNILDVSVTI